MADCKVLQPDAEEGTDRDRLFKNVPEKDNQWKQKDIQMMEETPNDFKQ